MAARKSACSGAVTGALTESPKAAATVPDVQRALLLLGVLAGAGAAHGAGSALPPPFFTAASPYIGGLAASGSTVALATVERSRCVTRLLRPAAAARPTLVRPPDPCGGPDT